jgi:hypothetical protein
MIGSRPAAICLGGGTGRSPRCHWTRDWEILRGARRDVLRGSRAVGTDH